MCKAYNGEWTEIDEKNKEIIENIYEKYGVIDCDLLEGHRAITMNMLIEFCRHKNIDFDTPIFLHGERGNFPLLYFDNLYGVNTREDGDEIEFDYLSIQYDYGC